MYSLSLNKLGRPSIYTHDKNLSTILFTNGDSVKLQLFPYILKNGRYAVTYCSHKSLPGTHITENVTVYLMT